MYIQTYNLHFPQMEHIVYFSTTKKDTNLTTLLKWLSAILPLPICFLSLPNNYPPPLIPWPLTFCSKKINHSQVDVLQNCIFSSVLYSLVLLPLPHSPFLGGWTYSNSDRKTGIFPLSYWEEFWKGKMEKNPYIKTIPFKSFQKYY